MVLLFLKQEFTHKKKRKLLSEVEESIVIDLLDTDKTCLTTFCSH